MFVEPFLHGLRVAIGQQVDDAAALEVHDDRPVPLSSAQCPVVDPYESGRRRLGIIDGLDATQDRVGTR